jgi:Protein of unknown function (DUF1822)
MASLTQTKPGGCRLPITDQAHRSADRFRQQQPNPAKAKQVYLNTLAVQAVQTYLSWWGIATDLNASDSWNPAMQALTDTADLLLPGIGRLECRSVLPGDTDCRVPPEVWSDRIGYVAVQFDAALRAATLLGFVTRVTRERVPIVQLQALEELFDSLQPANRPAVDRPIHLSQWLKGAVETGWQTVEELLGPQFPRWSFRGGGSLHSVEPPMIRGNLLNLGIGVGIGLEETSVALFVGVLPTETEFMEVWIRVCPINEQTYLPTGLAVMVLDAEDIVVMQAQSRHTDMIQLRFSGVLGEMFSIKVTLGRQSVIKVFVI